MTTLSRSDASNKASTGTLVRQRSIASAYAKHPPRQLTAPAGLRAAVPRPFTDAGHSSTSVGQMYCSLPLIPRTAPTRLGGTPGTAVGRIYDVQSGFLDERREHSEMVEAENRRIAALLALMSNNPETGGPSEYGGTSDFVRRVIMAAERDAEMEQVIKGNERVFADLLRMIERALRGELILGAKDELSMSSTNLDATVDFKRREKEQRERMLKLKEKEKEREKEKREKTREERVDLFGEKSKSTFGRKSVRTILEELEQKIDTLKGNQMEWDRFQLRVGMSC